MKMLIIFQNIIQYEALKPLMLYIRKKDLWKFDIFIYGLSKNDMSGFCDISEELKQSLIEDGFGPMIKEKISERQKYKVCMAPYSGMVDAKYDYLIGYYYGSASSKPFTFSPDSKMMFHGVLLHSTYDAEVLSVYSKTYIVPNLRLNLRLKSKKTMSGGKKVLLYLPTYGDINSIKELYKSLTKLKSEYYIITKGHHGTEHLKSEVEKKQLLLELSDEYFTPAKNINELFKVADLVLSDNSGAIFDAMYAGVPVCVAAKNINNKFGNLNTLQSELANDGILPYSNKTDFSSIKELLLKTKKNITLQKQVKLAKKIFTNRDGGVEAWVEVLSKYMNDKVNKDYVSLHNMYTDQIINDKKRLDDFNKEVKLMKENLEKEKALLESVQKEFFNYRQEKLHRYADRIYKALEKLQRRYKK